MDPKRKMQINDRPEQTPEQELIQITRWVKEDFEKMSSTLWMILQEPEMIEAIARHFQVKMNKEKPVNQIVKALADQKEVTKQQ